ncbi:uncharacterized protein LOC110673287 isoform X2 [Hevea brasiliensis]|uniref:uncharacterized protein LOC110673287 isoform X2 n=1 Tax=Hevea brasiliensis TaxID=3981 RepID=UPI0025D093E1|nr:uncharacterized protein LOC110673287 isoform X2 [Hevea brasiliensis]
MGEMGNNNTSGLREEDNTTPGAQGKSLEEPFHNGEVKGENYAVPTTGSKDYNRKETGLASDDPTEAGEPPVDNQISDGTEAEKKSNEEGGNDRDIQRAVSLPMELEDHKNPTLSENVLEISNNQIEKQSSFKKAGDMESEDSAEPNSDQHEYTKVDAHQQEDRNDSLRGIADVLGSSTAYNSKETGHQLDTHISDNLEGTIVSGTNVDVERKRNELLVKEMASQENEKPGKYEFEDVGNEDGNIFGKTIMVSSDLLCDVGEKYDGELASKKNCNGILSLESKLEANLVADSLNSHLEVSPPEDKCMVFSHETKLIGKELTSEENKANASQTDSLTGLNCKNIEIGGSLITAHYAAGNGNCETEEVKVVEESDNQNEASEENCKGSEGKIAHELGIFAAQSSIANTKSNEEESGDCLPEAYTTHDAANNGNCQVEEAKVLVESDNQNECSEENCNGSEGKQVMVHELGITAAKLSIANGKNNEEESEDFRREALTANDDAINGNCQVEEVKVVEDSDEQKEAPEENFEEFEGKIGMIHELGIIAGKSSLANGKINEEESGVNKTDEAYEEKIMFPELATVAAELPVTKNEEEAVDCKAEEDEPAEKQIVETKEKTEAPCAPAEEHMSCTPASLFQSEHQQQETVKKSEDVQDSTESTLEPKPESSSEFISTASSNFHSLVSAVEKPVEEVLPHATAGPEMVTETISSASANHSSEQHEKNETYAFARDGIEAQENAERVNTEPIPENLIQAEVEKSPSSTVESTASVVQLGMEKPQQESPHYNTTVLEGVAQASQAESSASASQSSEQCGKVETSVLARGGYEPQESAGMFSTQSIPDNLNIHDAAGNGNCETEEVKVVEESDNQNEASEENCKGSEGKIAHELGIFAAISSIANTKSNEEESGDCLPDAANNGNCQVEEAKVLVESDNQNECSEEHCNGSEGKQVIVHELGITAAKLSIANGKNNEEESEDFRPEALTANDDAINGNCQVEEVKVVEDSDEQKEAPEENCEEFEGKIGMIHELGIIAGKSSLANRKINEEESGVNKTDEAYEEKIMFPELATVAAELPVTKNEEEAVDCKAEEDDPAKKQIVETKEKTEAPCAPAEEHMSCTPASLFQSEHQQQETVKKPEDVQDSTESTLEPKPESSSEFIATASSNFHSLVSAVEKPVEEVLPHVTAGPEMVTETISSASANHSSEQHEKNDTYAFARDGIEAQENAERVNTEPIPENLIQAEVEKSPSSTVESTASVVQLGMEKPQQVSPHYNTTVLEGVAQAAQAESSASASQSSEQCAKVETSLLAMGGYEPQETAGMFSTQSIPDNLNIHAEMRKSPSFNLDLRREARSEESDQTPLLYQDKNAVEDLSRQADVSLRNSLPQAQYGQESFKYDAMPMEEKVITLERSDSEKSRKPFLGFLKEDEEAHVVVIPKKKEDHGAAKKTTKDSWNSSSAKEISSTPPKNKEKHKRRSSLFTNCMCCTTVIN